MYISLLIFSYVLSIPEGKYFVDLGTILTIKVREGLFVCLNKMFHERSLDVDETGSMYRPVHLYIHTRILEIRF